MEALGLDEAGLAEIQFLISQLQIILGTDNDARKGAEEHLKKIKDGEPDKYASYLTAVIADPGASTEIKSLSCVLLRRSIGSNITGQDKTLWVILSQGARDYLKVHLLKAIESCTIKDVVHKLANLLVEIAGGMYEHEDEAIW